MTVALNIALLAVGSALLGLRLGWEVGVGAFLIALVLAPD